MAGTRYRFHSQLTGSLNHTQTVVQADVKILDLAGIGFAEPCGIVALATVIDRMSRSAGEVRVECGNRDAVRYMSRMNFGDLLDSLGVSHNMPVVGHHDRRGSLVELQRFEGTEGADAIADLLLAKVEAGTLQGTLASNVYNQLWELTANAAEHSGVELGYALAQSFPRRGMTSIVVGDPGIGILESFANSSHSPSTDIEAINLAVQRRVSRHDKNRGVGLFNLVRDVADRGGGMVNIYSGGARRLFGGTSWTDYTIPPKSGTLVRADLRS